MKIELELVNSQIRKIVRNMRKMKKMKKMKKMTYYDLHRMKFITHDQHDSFTALLAKEIDDAFLVRELKDAVRVLLKQVDVMGISAYDEKFGNSRLCKCGHTYYRHFDSYEDMSPVGCKYCHGEDCSGYEDTGTKEVWRDHKRFIEEYVS